MQLRDAIADFMIDCGVDLRNNVPQPQKCGSLLFLCFLINSSRFDGYKRELSEKASVISKSTQL